MSFFGKTQIEDEIQRLQTTKSTGGHGLLADLLKRPEHTYETIHEFDPDRPEILPTAAEQAAIQIKYDGYIQRQLLQVEKFKRLEERKLPENLDYNEIQGLRREAQQKLSAVKPRSIGQAGRISGVSPADINVLLVFLEQHRHTDRRREE